jgi:hypothetical protein
MAQKTHYTALWCTSFSHSPHVLFSVTKSPSPSSPRGSAEGHFDAGFFCDGTEYDTW